MATISCKGFEKLLFGLDGNNEWPIFKKVGSFYTKLERRGISWLWTASAEISSEN